MRMSLIAAVPVDPLPVVIVVGAAIACLLFLEIKVRNGPPARIWVRDGAYAVAVLVGIAILPVRLHALFALLSVGFLGGLLILAGSLRFTSDLALRRFRANLRTPMASLRDAPSVLLATEARPARDAFVALGFTEVKVTERGGDVAAMLLDERNGIVAEVVSSPQPQFGPGPVTELSSTLAGRRGVLATSTSGLYLQLWSGELRQVFPGATPQHLLENHLSALTYLAEHGIAPDPMSRDEVIDVRDEIMQRHRTHLASVPSRTLKAELGRLHQRQQSPIGPLAAQPDIEAKIEALYGLMLERE